MRLVVVHRWGVRYQSPEASARSYLGVLAHFRDPRNQASAHVVYPGSALDGGGAAAQLVRWSERAWTEAAFNPVSDEVESADAIWLGHDWHGLQVLARIVAKRLRVRRLPPVALHPEQAQTTGRGFCRHADLGAAGGGHTSCPTTDDELWADFAQLVAHEYQRRPFRPRWGRV